MFRITHFAGITGMVFLAGCSLNISGGLFQGSEPHAYAVGDNPYAVKTATAVLEQGGNAADAATAMFFTLAATDPAAAGLGGGGVCLVHNPADDSNTEYAFLPGADGNGEYAIPSAVKGFARLHYRFGQMAWEKVISPGEGFAHTGFPMTVALHKRLEANLDKIRLDATLSREFLDETGKLKPVGSQIYAIDLAGTMTEIRINGPESFYTGKLAQKISGYGVAQISPEKLAAYRTLVSDPEKMHVDGYDVWVPDAKSGAAGYIRTLLTKTAGTEKKSAFIAALKKLKSGDAADHGATGFAVTDSHGMSVTCAVTMNTPFGAARTVPGTGIVLAPAKGNGADYLSPVIAADSAGSSADFTAASAGGPASNASVAAMLVRLGHGEEIYERSQMDDFSGAETDLANMIVCDGDECVAMADPKGLGLGLTIVTPKKE